MTIGRYGTGTYCTKRRADDPDLLEMFQTNRKEQDPDPSVVDLELDPVGSKIRCRIRIYSFRIRIRQAPIFGAQIA